MEKKVHTIALTGGPCGGKSTALPLVKAELEQLGYDVAVVPEVAALLLANGYRLREAARDGDDLTYLILQTEICRVQLALEDAHRPSLEFTSERGVILCDRGLIDNKAYVPTEEAWRRITKQFSWRAHERWLDRYDYVYHLVSAADGAHEHYKSEGVRTEDLDVALTLEERTFDAWGPHQNRRVIDNEFDGFEGKLKRLLEAIRTDFGGQS